MKRYLCIGLLLALSLCFVACSAHIEDTNGADDHSLTTITKEELLGNSSAVQFMTVRSVIPAFWLACWLAQCCLTCSAL